MTNINDYRPPCPVIFFERQVEEGKKQIFTIHCEKLDVDVECYVSTAIVKMNGIWTNRTKNTLECVFALPTTGTIMNVTLRVGEERVITTAIISEREAKDIVKENQKKREVVPEQQNPAEQYVPDLFRLPFGNIEPNDTIRLSCQYLQPLNYYKKGYAILLPLYFQKGTIVEHLPWEDVVKVRCKIHAITKETKYECWSHEVTTEELPGGTILVETVKCRPVEENKHDDHPMYSNEEPLDQTGRDFELSYSVKSDEILAHAIRKWDDDEDNPDSYSMCIFVTPPRSLSTTFGRAFYFILDRSGSMVGEPYQEATRALFRALDRLRPTDMFGICAFDHHQEWLNKAKLLKASKENINESKSWVQKFGPERGGTVMDKPIKEALKILEATQLLPFIVLITDGAVHNEKDIVKALEGSDAPLRTRIITLGIGTYCNWFFLKMLSKIGRGFSDVVVYREHIYHKIDHLLKMASTPVLTDIEIGFRGDDITIYPFPVPDLFLMSPIVAAARYTTQEKPPKNVIIRGFNPKGEQEEILAKIKDTPELPVDKIFIKQQIDLLTAQAWYQESKQIQEQVVQASCEHNIPSQYTSLIAFEAKQEALEERGLLEDDDDEKKEKDGKEKKQKNSKKLAKLRNNKGTIAALAIGGTAAIVAVSVASFGDVQATMDNIPMGGGDFDLGGGDCCDCSDGACDCGDDCGEGCGDGADCECLIM